MAKEKQNKKGDCPLVPPRRAFGESRASCLHELSFNGQAYDLGIWKGCQYPKKFFSSNFIQAFLLVEQAAQACLPALQLTAGHGSRWVTLGM